LRLEPAASYRNGRVAICPTLQETSDSVNVDCEELETRPSSGGIPAAAPVAVGRVEKAPVENLSKRRADRVENLCAKINFCADRASFVRERRRALSFVLRFACLPTANA
jgi:hypothetical protein